VAPLEHPLVRLGGAPLFRGLSASQCKEIIGVARERTFSRDATIFVEDDPLHSVYIVAAGTAKTIRHSAVGKLVILQVAGPGDVLDGLGFSLGGTHSVTARALGQCQVLSWDINLFESLTDRFPALLRNSIRLLVRRLRLVEGRFHELATERVPQRLARVLLRLIVQAGRNQRCSHVSFSCEELAQMAGTTMFTVSRLLCDWAARGIIQPERSAILAENIPGLIAIATQEESV
jgi:CRP/FNR family transcriptional regulator, nitrogen oxide reductase regulator